MEGVISCDSFSSVKCLFDAYGKKNAHNWPFWGQPLCSRFLQILFGLASVKTVLCNLSSNEKNIYKLKKYKAVALKVKRFSNIWQNAKAVAKRHIV